jgi:GSH-dependent disulfide-bond oxidoreductase
MFGQAYHFLSDASIKVDYAIDRYTQETRRLCEVVDRRLAATTYLAGPTITIADFANLPWLQWPASFGVDPRDVPNVMRWVQLLRERPSVQRGLNVPPRIAAASTPSARVG